VARSLPELPPANEARRSHAKSALIGAAACKLTDGRRGREGGGRVMWIGAMGASALHLLSLQPADNFENIRCLFHIVYTLSDIILFNQFSFL
jgi:hypothetical protein